MAATRGRGDAAAGRGRQERPAARTGRERAPEGAREASSARRRSTERTPGIGERLIAGVPARIMRPRLVFLACLGAILAFGLLMVYSASSVEALKEQGSSTYFLVRQAIFIGIGLVFMVGVASVPLSVMRSRAMWWVWGATLVILLAVLVLGENIGGATRWIRIAGQQFQPSEFAKPVIIVTAAKVLHEYYEEESIDTPTFLMMLGGCVLAPLLLIILEPDFGTCLIIGGTVFVMCYFAGFSYALIGGLVAVALAIGLALILGSGYRSARLLADPWSDPYGDGYQATLAIMAFASGGLLGRGIGNSTMKYNYLPEAHNDYILAIIGEELGYVGTLIFFAVYLLMIVAAFRIASRSPTVQGRLIAYGAAVMFMLQFLINALGILGVTPMTGKTMPFISYGGSSMMASLSVAGLILRVSRESNVATVYDERRSSLRVVDESTAGEPRVRSARAAGFSVVEGAGAPRDGMPGGDGTRAGWQTPPAGAYPRGAAPAGAGADDGAGARYGRRRSAPLSGRSTAAGTAGGSGYGRIDLGGDPADRLRTRSGRAYDARRDAYDAADPYPGRGAGRYDGSGDGRTGRGARAGRGGGRDGR